jgi:hypothetical protein
LFSSEAYPFAIRGFEDSPDGLSFTPFNGVVPGFSQGLPKPPLPDQPALMVRAPCRLATSIISSIFAEFDPDHAIADKSTRNPPSWGWEVSFSSGWEAQLSPSIVSPIRQSTDVSAEPGDTPHEFWVAYYQRMRVPPPVARRLDTHLANTLNVIGHYLMAVAGRLRLPLNIGHLFLGGRSNNPLLLLIACDSLLIALVRLGNSLQMSLMGEHLLATQTAGNQRRIFTHDGLIIIEKTPNGEYPVLPLEHELRNFFELGFSVVDPSSTTPRIVIRGVGANVAGFLLAAREAGLCPTAAITHNLDAPDLSVVRDVVDVGVTIISHVAIPTFEAQISTYLAGRPTPEWRRSSSALKPLTRSVRRCFALLSLNLYSNCLPSPEETLATAAFLLILLDSQINSLFINDSFSAPPLLVAGLAI